MTTKKKRPRKQTTQRVSRIAGSVLQQLEGESSKTRMWTWNGGTITIGDVRALAASCLSQDERKGK